jgi:hypothetical protein
MVARICSNCADYDRQGRDVAGVSIRCTKLLMNTAPECKGCRFFRPVKRVAK